MSRLYVSADSDSIRTARTARGRAEVTAHPRGWDTGVRATVRAAGKTDSCAVYRTGGSGAESSDRLLAAWDSNGAAVILCADPGDILRIGNGPAYILSAGPDGAPILSPVRQSSAP